MSKYNNSKHEVDGILFASKKEANRYVQLKVMQELGLITELETQKKYQIIPAQRDPDTGKVIRATHYIADFVYRDNAGRLVVEDVKGFRRGTAYDVFRIKQKLMLHVHGIKVMEV